MNRLVADSIINRVYEQRKSECGRGRATYEPNIPFSDRPTERPWIVAVDGTVIQHAATLQQAFSIIRSKGISIGEEK